MGWFDEQIKYRKDRDNKAFGDALEDVAAIIEGRKQTAYSNESEEIMSALHRILDYYGCKAQELPPDVDDLHERIDYLCRPHGIMYRSTTLERGWYKDAAGVYLTTLKTGQIVTLLPNRFDLYEYQDPTTGKTVRVNHRTEQLLEREAYCFYKPLPQRALGVRDLAAYIMGAVSPMTILLAIVLTLLGTGIGLLIPKLTRIIFADIIASSSLKLLVGIAVLYICMQFSMLLIQGIKSLIMSKIRIQMDVSIQAATMARILSLPPSFFKEYNAGEIYARSNYVNSLCSTLVDTVLTTGITGVFSLLYFTQILTYAPALSVPALCIIVASLVMSLLATHIQTGITKELNLLESEQMGLTYQIISGIQKIRLSGSEKRIFAKWLRHYSKEAALTYNPPKFLLFHNTISLAITTIGTLVLYYCAVVSHVSVADYTAFQSAYGMLSAAFQSIAAIALTAAAIKPILEMAKPILEATPEISEGRQMITSIHGAVELSHVSFAYNENAPLVIDDLSLQIRSGQYVAIVGRTGCGKSTLLRLLLGFEQPQKGAIYYDGKDLRSIDLRSLRKKIGTVTQDGKLFSGDIYSNIVISAPYLSVEDAWKAAEIADIADDIREMPMGMFTMIAEGNGGISGGQKQRLMIARAVAPSPKILMFDEATSALDNITQRRVSDALAGMNCTRIVVAHRLSTIQQCDRILVLDQGKIIEDGTYDELIAQKGFFYDLVERQRLE